MLPLALVAAFGLAVGSFLNVCIYRVPLKLSIVSPRSRCGSCGHTLAWFENIPVLSYFALRARCRSCHAPISIVYPSVELLTAVVFVFMYWWYGPTLLLGARLVFACVMIVLFVIDLQHQILPNRITLPGIAVGFALSVLAGPGLVDSLAGTALGGGVLFGIAEIYYRVRHEEGLGMGDVKMLAMIGAFLGWRLVLVTLVLSSVLGSLVGVGLIVVQRKSLKYALPFGTFLAVGAVIAAVAGNALLDWYLGWYPQT
jgi:leader peptidase (prepilin peptidase) / N-methyltransferase